MARFARVGLPDPPHPITQLTIGRQPQGAEGYPTSPRLCASAGETKPSFLAIKGVFDGT
jgi:hypothetical protein